MPSPRPPLYAFAHVPKAGGTTLADLLRQHFGARLIGVHYRGETPVYTARDLERDLRVYPFAQCITGHSLKPYVDFSSVPRELRWFTVLREPVARFISHYQHQYDRSEPQYRLPFDEWMRTYNRRNWTVRMIAGEEDVEAAKQILGERFAFVGLLDRFEESLLLLRERLGLRGFDVDFGAPSNAAPKTAVQKKVRANMDDFADAIREQNRLDLELYAWVRDTLWPAQVAEYGAERLAADLASTFGRGDGPTLPQAARRWQYLAYRNLVYKPYLRLESAVSA